MLFILYIFYVLGEKRKRKTTRGSERVNNLPKISKFICHRSDDRVLFLVCKLILSLPQGQDLRGRVQAVQPLLGTPWQLILVLWVGPGSALTPWRTAGLRSLGLSIWLSQAIWLPEMLWLPWHLPQAPLSVNLGASCFEANGEKQRNSLTNMGN